MYTFDESKEIDLIVDSSKIATGAILAQRQDDKKLHPVGFFSKILPPLKSWSATELELRGIVTSVQHFKEFFYGRTFRITSDHRSLEYFKTFEDSTSRLNKLVAQLVDYDFIINYAKCSSPALKAVDHLSRYPTSFESESVNCMLINETDTQGIDIAEMQMSDEEIRPIINAFQNPSAASNELARI